MVPLGKAEFCDEVGNQNVQGHVANQIIEKNEDKKFPAVASDDGLKAFSPPQGFHFLAKTFEFLPRKHNIFLPETPVQCCFHRSVV